MTLNCFWLITRIIYTCYTCSGGFLGGRVVKNPPANAGDTGDMGSIPGLRRSPGGENGNHSSILAWIIPWTEEPGGLQAMGSQRVRHNWATERACTLYLFLLRTTDYSHCMFFSHQKSVPWVALNDFPTPTPEVSCILSNPNLTKKINCNFSINQLSQRSLISNQTVE